MTLYDEALKFRGKRVLVVGDVMVDKYVYGTIRGLSQEVPIPILVTKEREYRLGGAANVAHNAARLEAHVTLAGVTGEDAPGKVMASKLQELNIENLLIATPDHETTVKNRFMARDDDHPAHLMLRVDDETTEAPTTGYRHQMLDRIDKGIRAKQYDAIIFSDYNKGLFWHHEVARYLLAEADREGIPVIVAPKPDNEQRFRGFTLVVPNRKEAEMILGKKLKPEEAVIAIREHFESKYSIITYGKEGMYGFNGGGVFHEATKVQEVVDITGAGDTVLAVCGLGMASGMQHEGLGVTNIAKLANVAAGIVVKKPGTYAVTLDEVLEEIKRQNL